MYLNTERMRVVVRDETNGRVTKRVRYSFGDKVDVSDLVPGRADALVESGALVESRDDLGKPRSSGAAVRNSPLIGAATEGHGSPVVGADVKEAEQDDGTLIPKGDGNGDPDDPDNPKTVDQYDNMDYATLQKEAKGRDLSGGGSADDLRTRLREDDAENGQSE